MYMTYLHISTALLGNNIVNNQHHFKLKEKYTQFNLTVKMKDLYKSRWP